MNTKRYGRIDWIILIFLILALISIHANSAGKGKKEEKAKSVILNEDPVNTINIGKIGKYYIKEDVCKTAKGRIIRDKEATDIIKQLILDIQQKNRNIAQQSVMIQAQDKKIKELEAVYLRAKLKEDMKKLNMYQRKPIPLWILIPGAIVLVTL